MDEEYYIGLKLDTLRITDVNNTSVNLSRNVLTLTILHLICFEILQLICFEILQLICFEILELICLEIFRR